MEEFAFEEDEPQRSYSSRSRDGGRAGCALWMGALALILVPTFIFMILMGTGYSKLRADAVEAKAENDEIEKKYRGKTASDADLRKYEDNLDKIKSGGMSFVEFVMVANVLYLLLFIPYVLIVLITAFCLSQAAKG